MGKRSDSEGALWSFDDYCIEIKTESGDSIQIPVIKRIRNITKSDWYRLASSICLVFNSKYCGENHDGIERGGDGGRFGIMNAGASDGVGRATGDGR